MRAVKFPVKTPKDLIAASPNDAGTICRIGGLKMIVGKAGQ